MRVTGEGIREMRNLTGLGVDSIRKAVRIAEERFDGDILLGIGYVDRSGLAVFRKDRERSLERDARAFADRHRLEPEWQAVLALFADPDEPSLPAPGS